MPRGHRRDLSTTKRWRDAGVLSDIRSFYATDGCIFLYGADWKDQVELMIQRDNVCTECGSTVNLDADHIRSKGNVAHRGDDSLDNLRCLCRRCHERRHNDRSPQWARKGKECQS
jgi:hypothetical protein